MGAEEQFDEPPFDARAVANIVLGLCEERGLPVYTTTLLKVLYFAHGWYLAKFNRALIGQPFEAWQHGPVLRVVYDQIKPFSRGVVEGRLTSFDPQRGEYVEAHCDVDLDTKRLIGHVLAAYGALHPYRLSEMTHEEDSPWFIAWEAATKGLLPGARIKNSAIRGHFLKSTGAGIIS